jgi:glycosyltransferase involved in cell wall biosynthesis
LIDALRIIFTINVDWFFLSHRLPIATEALKNGAEVWVITANTGHKQEIESYGFKFIDFPFTRRGTNIFKEATNLPRLYNLYRKIKPDLVHHVSIKPVIYGSIVARILKKIKVINAVTGMGFAFSDDDKATGINTIVKRAYRIALNNRNVRVVFQNEVDRDVFIQKGLVKQVQTVLIQGSGVDTQVYKPSVFSIAGADLIVLLASRMIWDKGIKEFVKAAEIVKKEIPNVRFILAGKADNGNPNVVPVETLREWERQNKIEWLGHHEDMVSLLQKATIVTLPTYYPEGVPKILIEAASSGRPIITTNRPGCRDIVRHGENGILIPEKDTHALADAILMLLNNPELRESYGKNGRQLVIDQFSEEKVVSETMNLYDELLGVEWRKPNC